MINAKQENWVPDECLVSQIAIHNIPANFTYQCVNDFQQVITRDTKSTLSLRSLFIKHVLQKWRQQLMQPASNSTVALQNINLPVPTVMQFGWSPDSSVMNILINNFRITRNFVEDAIPEFVLYWSERGETHSTWNSKFVLHVKRQWVRYKESLETTNQLTKISSAWQPSEQVYDVLRLAKIDIEFAKTTEAEFIIYWSESGRTYASWNTKFLQHVKYLWSKKHAPTHAQHHSSGSYRNVFTSSRKDKPRSTRDISLLEQLTDRSWADGIILRN